MAIVSSQSRWARPDTYPTARIGGLFVAVVGLVVLASALLGGKHYFDLGNATMTVSADQKSAHLDGTGDRLSDAPNKKITVDVTC